MKKNWESDFVAEVKMPDGLEMVDVELEFRTTGGLWSYRASRKGKTVVNCVDEGDGTLMVVFKDHHLPPGKLKMKAVANMDCAYCEGGLRTVWPKLVDDVELWDGASDNGTVDVNVLECYAIIDAWQMAVKNGYTGSKEDYCKALGSMPGTVAKAEELNAHQPRVVDGWWEVWNPSSKIYERSAKAQGDGVYMVDTIEAMNALENVPDGSRCTVTGSKQVTKNVMQLLPGDTVNSIDVDTTKELGTCSESKSYFVYIQQPMGNTYIIMVGLNFMYTDMTSLMVNMENVWNNMVVDDKLSVDNTDNLLGNVLMTEYVGEAYTEAEKAEIKLDGLIFHVTTAAQSTYARKGGKWELDATPYISTLALNGFSYIKAVIIQSVIQSAFQMLPIVQETGNSDTNIMSQKAVTEALKQRELRVELCNGANSFNYYLNGSNVTGTATNGLYSVMLKENDEVRFSYNNMQNIAAILSAPYLVLDYNYSYKRNLRIIRNAKFKGNLDSMFKGMDKLVEISNCTFENVTSVNNCFSGCSSLRALPMMDTQQCTSFNELANKCLACASFPSYNASKVTNMSSMFSSCDSVYPLPLELDTSKVTTAQAMFANSNDSKPKAIGFTESWDQYWSVPRYDFSALQNVSLMFYCCYFVEKLPLFNFSAVTTGGGNCFSACSNLNYCKGFTGLAVSMNFSSTKLDRTSINNIIDQAADLTGKTAQTLTFGSTLLAKLNDDDKAKATAKNWTLA